MLDNRPPCCEGCGFYKTFAELINGYCTTCERRTVPLSETRLQAAVDPEELAKVDGEIIAYLQETTMQKLDHKFSGEIKKASDGSIVPPDSYIVFLAKDNAFPATLRFYLEECKRLGAGPVQVEAVQGLIDRVDAWRAANPTLCKVPDATKEQLKRGSGCCCYKG